MRSPRGLVLAGLVLALTFSVRPVASPDASVFLRPPGTPDPKLMVLKGPISVGRR